MLEIILFSKYTAQQAAVNSVLVVCLKRPLDAAVILNARSLIYRMRLIGLKKHADILNYTTVHGNAVNY